MKLTEIFQNNKEWEQWFAGSEEFLANFSVGDINYRFSASVEDPVEKDMWFIEFQALPPILPKDRYTIIGTGNSVTTFSIVVDIMSTFLNKYGNKVQILTFSAEEPSRKRLYTAMCKKLLPDWDMHLKWDIIELSRPGSKQEEQ